ncbi:surface protease GP63, putative, partial [Trypanosoma cruzi]
MLWRRGCFVVQLCFCFPTYPPAELQHGVWACQPRRPQRGAHTRTHTQFIFV